LFQNSLLNDDVLSQPVQDVEQGYKNLLISYKKARDISVPIKTGPYKHKYSPYWNSDCSEAKLNKKTAEKALRKTNNIANQIEFKKCKAKLKFLLTRAKKVYWDKFCAGMSRQTKLNNVWNTVNKLKGIKSEKRLILRMKMELYWKTQNLLTDLP